MPDYPYVYGSSETRPISPGGTRIRLLRRRGGQRQGGETGANPEEEKERGEHAWRALLEHAVEDLNASLRASGAPFACALEEDEAGFILRVRREGEPGEATEIEEEVLAPAELPKWLSRIRSRLGILVDQSA